jgi:hypothetical protein
MKINPLAIQSYQPPNTNRSQAEQRPAVKTGSDEKIVLTPQPESKPSALAVKATPTDYGAHLTEPERRAMETLFARFKDSGRLSGGGASEPEAERGLGQIIDIKV